MRLGILLSIIASTLFAMMPIFLQLLPDINSFAVIGQRILWSCIIITLVLLAMGDLRSALQPLTRLSNWPGLVGGALLIGSMWAVFVWGPLNGETLGVAMGFFLAPMVMIVVGLIIFKDRLSHLQYLAAAVALAGVILNLWNTGEFSWVALVIAIGYPLYLIFRRLQPIPVLAAFYMENLLLAPLAIWACVVFGEVRHPFDYEIYMLLLFFGISLLGTSGILFFLAASKRLPLALLGLLGYLEPFLIFLIALFILDEKILPGEGMTYGLICAAMLLLVLDGLLQFLKQGNRKQSD